MWYACSPAGAGRVAAELISHGSSASVAVYTGPTVSSLHAVGKAGPGYQGRVAFDAAPGRPTGSRPPLTTRRRSSCTSGRPLCRTTTSSRRPRWVAVPSRTTGSVADATTELGEPDGSGSLWYRFTPRRTVRLSVQAVTPDNSGCQVSAFTGRRLSSLHRVGLPTFGTLRFRALRGREYRLSVASCVGFGDSRGSSGAATRLVTLAGGGGG